MERLIKELFGGSPSISELKNISIDEKGQLRFDGKNILVNTKGEKTDTFYALKEHNRNKRLENVFIRCSSLGKLMTDSRGKSNAEKLSEAKEELIKQESKLSELSEKALVMKGKCESKIEDLKILISELEKSKDEIVLSETTKSELDKIGIEAKYNRRKNVTSKQMQKGKDIENDSIDIYSILKGELFEKNIIRTIDKNTRLTGEVDIIDESTGEIIDIKSRYDVFTFFELDPEEQKKNDKWQLVGYSILYPEAKKVTIANVLTNNTDDAIMLSLKNEEYKWQNGEVPQKRQLEIIADQIYDIENFTRLSKYAIGEITDPEAIEFYNDFRDIPIESRVIEVSESVNEDLKKEVLKRIPVWLKYIEDKFFNY